MSIPVILAVLVGVLFGAVLLGLGLFFWYLISTVKSMQRTVDEATKVFEPLIKSGTLKHFSDGMAQLVGIGRQIVPAMGAINATVAAFNKAFFKDGVLPDSASTVSGVGPETDARGYARSGEELHMTYTEEGASRNEKAAEFEKMGQPLSADQIREGNPDLT